MTRAYRQGLFWQIWASLLRVAISYSLAAIIGIGLGILIGTNKMMSKALDPIFQLLRTVPPLACADCFGSPATKRTSSPFRDIHHSDLADFDQHGGGKTNSQDYNNVAKVLQLSRKEYFLISSFLLVLHFYGFENCGFLFLVGDCSRNCYVRIVGIGFYLGISK